MTAPLVIIALAVVAIALVAMARRQFGSSEIEIAADPRKPLAGLVRDQSMVTLPSSLALGDVYQAQMNSWIVKTQANDQRPMHGRIARSTGAGSGSVVRADTRRSLQEMHKEWSRDRHD